MSEKILFVDDAPEALECFRRLLLPQLEVATARTGEEGLALCSTEGPFAVVVSDYEMPGMKGSEFLARVRELWPESVAILLTGMVDLDVAIDALHAGRIFRFLEKPCPRTTLRTALDAALEEHRARIHARRQRDELDFSSRVLAQFNGTLDARLQEQGRALLVLHRCVCALNACETFGDLARLAATTCADLLPGRGVRAELYHPADQEHRSRAEAGPELGERCHVQPVQSQEGQVGALAVSGVDGDGRRLSQDERAMLASLASSLSVAAFHLIRRYERDEAQHATILALAKLAEQRDNDTGSHLERVSQYCRMLAEGLREAGHHVATITDAYVRDLERSAPLHDIGKVGIPDAILRKPGKLSPEEWEVMKTHTTIGAETLRSVIAGKRHQRFLEMSLDIAWCHHEKWDGSGYPRGLAGEAIPLAARILAVADVYDALTTVRPYKLAWSHAESIAWIRDGGGGHFDPQVVDVLLARQDQADAIRKSLPDCPDEVERRVAALQAAG